MTATWTWQRAYLDRFYGPDRGWKNGTEEFHELLAEAIPKGSKILEIGAGPSNRTSRFLASIGELHGLDPDPDFRDNDALTTASVLAHGEGARYPFDDGAFDACVSNYVLEHVPDPVAHLAEVARVLRPGGAYVFRTPNRYHYVAIIASLTPHWFHELVANRARNLDDDAHEPYPTVYRMNTERAVRDLARGAGLSVDALRLIEKEPSYGMSSRVLFFTFMAYERAVNATERAAALRSNILAVLRKPGAT